MARNKRNIRKEDKQKTYIIKMPVYTMSIIEEEKGLFGAMNYSELEEMLKNSINAYHFPIEHRSNNKAVVIVLDGIQLK